MGEKSLKTAKNQKSVAKNKPKKISNEKMFLGMKKFFANRNFRYTCAVILMLVISYLVQYFVNKPNLGAFLSSDMDPNGNVYVLGIDNSDDRYRITKILKNGMAAYKINLDKSTDEFDYSYSNLEADSKGNFYFVKQKRNLKAVVADKSVYPILSETVLMFDTNGNYVKELATMDFSTYANPPVKSYIKKIQIVDQSINIIGSKDNVFDIVEAYPLIDKAPEKVKTFTVNAPTSTSDQNLEFVSDVSVLSSGRVFYATKNGEIWATDNQGVFTQCSSAISTSQFLMTDMTVDSNDNIFARLNGNNIKGFVKETWKSGTSWYRVWSDGWIEQGGRASLNERSSTAYTLHRPFSDTNYFVAASQYNVSTNDDSEMGIGCSPTSTTRFNAFCHYINPNTMNFMWYACGY